MSVPVLQGPPPTDDDQRMADQGVYVVEYGSAKEVARSYSETTDQARQRSQTQYGVIVADPMTEFKGFYTQFSDNVVHRMHSGPELPTDMVILRPALWPVFHYRRRILVRLPIMPWRGSLVQLLQLIDSAPVDQFPHEVGAIVDWFAAHEAYHQLLLNAGNLWGDYCLQLRHHAPPEIRSFYCGCNTTVQSMDHQQWVAEANRAPLCERMHRLSPAHYRFRELAESKHSYERREAFLRWARNKLREREPCPAPQLDERNRLLSLVRQARLTLRPCPHEHTLPVDLRTVFAQIRSGLDYQAGYTGEGMPNLADPILSMDCTVLLGHWRLDGDTRYEARRVMGLPDEDDDVYEDSDVDVPDAREDTDPDDGMNI